MPIRFRCTHCNQLHSIATRMAGRQVQCPTCGQQTAVPWRDESDAASITPLVSTEAADASEHVEAKTGAVAADEDEEDDAAQFSLRKPETDFEEMDLTPMVDVTFLLLIFFMITASFSLQKTIQVPPPDPDEQGAQQQFQSLEELETDSIIVEIDAHDAIVVDDEPLADPHALVDVFHEKMRTDLKAELVVAANAAARHEMVVFVIDAAQEVGMEKIRLATRGTNTSD